MKCITESRVEEWVAERDIVLRPYRSVTPDLQFQCPLEASRLSALLVQLFKAFGIFDGGLLVFEDWSTYQSHEMALIDSLRRDHGDSRPLVEAPGHLFDGAEESEAIGHCFLTAAFGWSAYWYLPFGDATLFFWEGDLVDFWSKNENLLGAVRQVVSDFRLQVTADA